MADKDNAGDGKANETVAAAGGTSNGATDTKGGANGPDTLTEAQGGDNPQTGTASGGQPATSKFTVKNTDEGPRGFETSMHRDVMLDPGKSEVFDLTDAEAERLKGFGSFKLTAKK